MTTNESDYTHIAPDGSQIRELLENQYAGLAHCILPAGNTSSTTQHKTVTEFWYVLIGTGQIWLKDVHGEQIFDLNPGLSIEIPSGTAFQFRSDKQADLVLLIVTMPPWPGPDEGIAAQGPWHANH